MLMKQIYESKTLIFLRRRNLKTPFKFLAVLEFESGNEDKVLNSKGH